MGLGRERVKGGEKKKEEYVEGGAREKRILAPSCPAKGLTRLTSESCVSWKMDGEGAMGGNVYCSKNYVKIAFLFTMCFVRLGHTEIARASAG